MGAETTVYIKVLVAKTEWREVSAVTLSQAKEEGERLPGVIAVVDAQYDPPTEETTDDVY